MRNAYTCIYLCGLNENNATENGILTGTTNSSGAKNTNLSRPIFSASEYPDYNPACR